MYNKKYFYICLSFDTDSDPNFKFDQRNKRILGWKGMSGIYLIRKEINKLEKKYKIEIPLTWFVRSDNQIKFYKKKSTWLLEKYKAFWKKEMSNGSELQWHAHLYRRENENWFQENNIDKIKKDLKSNLRDIKRYYKPECVRIGEAYMNNNLMNFLKKIKLRADSSCLPGRKRHDKEKYFDWSHSRNQPYFPSNINYQKNQNKILDFLEIPMNTIYTKTTYDKEPIKRYINLSFKPQILKKNLNKFIKNNKFLVSITHPYEILKMFKNRKNSKLVTFDIFSLRDNIEQIIAISKKNELEMKFITMSQLIKIKFKDAKKISSKI
jgi:hypothetical protein